MLAIIARSVMALQQAGGGGGPSEAFRTGPGSDRLLLASHNRLLWYYYNSGKVDVLHEGQVRVRIRVCAGSMVPSVHFEGDRMRGAQVVNCAGRTKPSGCCVGLLPMLMPRLMYFQGSAGCGRLQSVSLHAIT